MNTERLMSDLMEINPKVVSAKSSSIASSKNVGTLWHSSKVLDRETIVSDDFNASVSSPPIQKSVIFSPVMHLDLVNMGSSHDHASTCTAEERQ